MTDTVLNSDNGLIAIALEMYAQRASEMGGDPRLIDKATNLSFIFKNKPANQEYDWPDGGFGEGAL